MSTVGAPLHTFRDASGKITVTVFVLGGDPEQEIWTNQEILVGDPDMVAVGGGGAASDGNQNTSSPGGPGSFLTASYPNTNFTGWIVSARDQQSPQTYALQSYVIGMKIAGLSPRALAENMKVFTGNTGASEHPKVQVGVPSDSWVMAGGGFQVEKDIPNLGTASYPVDDFTWQARSQDHMVPASASLTVYAIGIRNKLPGVGRVLSHLTNSVDGPKGHPSSTANVQPGYALTGGGAQTPDTVHGNLLWELVPSTDQLPWFRGSSMDHFVSVPASITTYAVGLRIG